jgi:hypothetical protein
MKNRALNRGNQLKGKELLDVGSSNILEMNLERRSEGSKGEDITKQTEFYINFRLYSII